MSAARDRIIGRVSLEKIKDYEGRVIVDVNEEITEDLAGSIQSAGIERVWVNGRVVFAGGAATGERPGRVLRRDSP